MIDNVLIEWLLIRLLISGYWLLCGCRFIAGKLNPNQKQAPRAWQKFGQKEEVACFYVGFRFYKDIVDHQASKNAYYFYRIVSDLLRHDVRY
jgi:hypothetical protein